MILKFDCYCPTEWGQSLKVVGSAPELGNWDVDKALPLECCELNRWRTTVECAVEEPVQYKYILVDVKSGTQSVEVRPSRKSAAILKRNGTCCCIDIWQNLETEYAAFLSSAFTKVLFKADKRFVTKKTSLNAVQQIEISCCVPKLKPSQFVCLSGNCEQLGDWRNHIPMSVENQAKWTIRFNMKVLPAEFEYKFIIKDIDNPESVVWTDGPNHRFVNIYGDSPISIKIDDGIIDVNHDKPRFAGVNVPVFSLRTENSFGVGDFSDLRKLVDWASKVGLKMIQILPINDTISTYSFLDSYPYNAISVFALNPLFIDVLKFGRQPGAKFMVEYEAARSLLNSNPDVDYNQVISQKLVYCRAIFESNFDENINIVDFQKFIKENSDWLLPYAAFSLLRDINHTGDFHRWQKYSVYSAKAIAKFFQPSHLYYRNAMFWCYMQFALDKQLREATAYARKHGVILKGDIPIGISRCSVDAWSNPHLFHFDGQAGAPPDFFSENGQNWGFPTYNWEEMAKDGYAWWRQRLAKMNDYFDAYRIDHILGFFRIWEIPTSAIYGMLGHFRPALPLSEAELFRAGVVLDYDVACKPQVSAEYIDQLFGVQAEKVKQTYLEPQKNGLFSLKPEFATQRQIYEKVVGHRAPEKLTKRTRTLLDGLTTIASDVLLLKDREQGCYHLRIDLQKTTAYKRLAESQRKVLDALYEDFFYHRHNRFWEHLAIQKLTALLQSSEMLVCGEDLGMIPDCVKPVMEQLGILSLEIQRMPKTFTEFAHLESIPYTSICATSSHDTSTIRGWWEENHESTQRYFNNWLNQKGKAPVHANENICKQIIEQHLQSPALCVMMPIQDFFALEPDLRVKNVEQERINIPANPRNYWKYRMHVGIERLCGMKAFNSRIRAMLEESNRLV